jgi:hypothetical protein
MIYGNIFETTTNVKLWKWNPENIHGKTLIKSDIPSTSYAGAYFDRKLYFYDSSSATFFILDAITGALIHSVYRPELIGRGIYGLAYDYTNNTMYAVESSITPTTSSKLHTVNLTTGELTYVTDITGYTAGRYLFELVIDLKGNMYTIQSGTNGTLYKINKTTGTLTSMGNTGKNVSGPQGMAFNYSDETIYWYATENNNNSRNFYKIKMLNNANTHILTTLETNLTDTRGTCLYFPYQHITYNIYRDNILIAANVTGATHSDLDFDIDEMHTWSIKAVCNGDESAPASVTKGVCSECYSLYNFAVNYTEDCKAKLTWNEPIMAYGNIIAPTGQVGYWKWEPEDIYSN